MEDVLITLLIIAISLIKMSQGFDFNLKTIFTSENNPVILKGIIITILLVPILFLLLILVLKPSIPLASALMIMAVCPSAELSLQQVQRLGGNVPLSAGIQVISALTSVVTIPVFLILFELILGIQLKIQYEKLIEDIAIAQFIPMIVGISLRKIFPSYAWVAEYVTKAAIWLMLICLVMVLIKHYAAFAEFKIQAYFTIIFATICAYLLGVAFAGKHIKQQISLAIESSLRSPGLAYLIAAENFSLLRVNLAIVPYVITTFFVVITCTFLLKSYKHK